MNHQQAVQNLAVESYLLGEMSPQEREAFEEHYFECSLCGEDVRAAARFMEDARIILGQPRPGSSRPMMKPEERRTPAWLAWLKPQFAAPALAALLLLVGFQSLRTIPDLRRQVEAALVPREVTSINLRRAVRGDASVLSVPPGAPVILILDFPESPAKGTPLQFIIESGEGDGGKEIQRIDGAAPEPGRSFNLMIPHLDLPSGPYLVVAKVTTKSSTQGQELGRFPFRLELQQGADRSK